MGRLVGDVVRVATRAFNPVWPPRLDEPLMGRLVIREHLHEIDHGEPSSIMSARCIFHRDNNNAIPLEVNNFCSLFFQKRHTFMVL